MTIAMPETSEKELTASYWMSLEDFSIFFSSDQSLSLHEGLARRLNETRNFIDYLLSKRIQVYGLTTGFADLRNTAVDVDKAALLSRNMIQSHDAGIGTPLPSDVTLGAMVLRAHSLSKGYSGFSLESLETLIQMINARIIPEVPCTGSLGASGDLAFLARLGMAMMGGAVPVAYRGEKMTASKALSLAGIAPMQPKAKEGLALTNGTSFMASMMGLAYLKQMKYLENLFALLGLFLNATSAIDAAFYEMVHTVRYQKGQVRVARILRPYLQKPDSSEVQNDYCIRCLPQILGPKLEAILEQRGRVENELNAITDNPLIFCGSEISPDVDPSRIIPFNGLDWTVVSGGNFHGETSSTVADTIAILNAKIALTLERQLTYMLNPFRNGRKFPIYLVADSKRAGFLSGYMISQYTGNALAHKISLLAHPASTTNITSANESEDVVSYGATAAQKLLDQQKHMNELLAIHLITTAQAYSLVRAQRKEKNALCEALFEKICSRICFPQMEDEGFDEKYGAALALLESGELGDKNALL
ncbi:MAG: aromatic amino acid lyase [Verrucomicrobiota bacterium]|nr:aromatic amino acid lyase [Verrucomicrobiota bacterium]